MCYTFHQWELLTLIGVLKIDEYRDITCATGKRGKIEDKFYPNMISHLYQVNA